MPPHHVPPMSQALFSFLVYCESKNLTPRTVQWYRTQLARVISLLGDVPVDSVTPDQLRSLVVYWTREHRVWPHLESSGRRVGLAPHTVNGYVRALKKFFGFLVEEEVLTSSPARRLQRLRAPLMGGTVLTADELLRVIDCTRGTSFTERRNHALVMLLADTGVRVGELAGIRLNDVSWGDRTISVLGKGRKVRAVPFGRLTARALTSYLSMHPSPDHPESFLFLSATGSPMVMRLAQDIIAKLGRRAGIRDRRISPHVFRRTFATLWISNGGDPFSLQRMLGHTTMEMVNRYVRLSTVDLQRSHALTGPIDRLRSTRG
ncbi:MAG: tyrosine-type recombinase/integrase [Armatimonadota bacterium]